MFEKEIKFIADVSLNKIKNLGSFITYEKLAGSDIHPAILNYISAELDYIIQEDRRKLLQESLFDYSGPEVSKYFNLIALEIKKSKKISYEDIKKLILQAVSFNVNFLVRPRWALTKLIYNESEVKSVEEINLNFNYIYFYDYIKNIFLSYIAKRKLVSLSITEFELILSKIDKELFSTEQKKLIDYSLYTIGEFFNIGAASTNIIPIQAVELFLKEKDLMELIFKLKKTFPQNSKLNFDVQEIRKALYSEMTMDFNFNDDALKEGEVKPVEKKNEEQPARPNTENQLIDERQAEKDSTFEEETVEEDLTPDSLLDKDLLDFYNSKINSIEEEKETETDNIHNFDSSENDAEDFESLYKFESDSSDLINDFENDIPSNLEDDKTENNEEKDLLNEHDDMIKNSDEDEVEELTNSFLEPETGKQQNGNGFDFSEEKNEQNFKSSKGEKGKDISNFMSKKDAEKIIKKIFENDKADFEHTIEKLKECNSYEEATEILKGVFFTYRVNPYSREAVIFTNYVSNFFEQM
jgi:hypothetical protein